MVAWVELNKYSNGNWVGKWSILTQKIALLLKEMKIKNLILTSESL